MKTGCWHEQTADCMSIACFNNRFSFINCLLWSFRLRHHSLALNKNNTHMQWKLNESCNLLQHLHVHETGSSRQEVESYSYFKSPLMTLHNAEGLSKKMQLTVNIIVTMVKYHIHKCEWNYCKPLFKNECKKHLESLTHLSKYNQPLGEFYKTMYESLFF